MLRMNFSVNGKPILEVKVTNITDKSKKSERDTYRYRLRLIPHTHHNGTVEPQDADSETYTLRGTVYHLRYMPAPFLIHKVLEDAFKHSDAILRMFEAMPPHLLVTSDGYPLTDAQLKDRAQKVSAKYLSTTNRKAHNGNRNGKGKEHSPSRQYKPRR